MRFNENKMLKHQNLQKNELIKMPIFYQNNKLKYEILIVLVSVTIFKKKKKL